MSPTSSFSARVVETLCFYMPQQADYADWCVEVRKPQDGSRHGSVRIFDPERGDDDALYSSPSESDLRQWAQLFEGAADFLNAAARTGSEGQSPSLDDDGPSHVLLMVSFLQELLRLRPLIPSASRLKLRSAAEFLRRYAVPEGVDFQGADEHKAVWNELLHVCSMLGDDQ